MARQRKPKLAVWKFASYDGCQLSVLDLEEELLSLAQEAEIANFPEASRAVIQGPYDLSLLEGSGIIYLTHVSIYGTLAMMWLCPKSADFDVILRFALRFQCHPERSEGSNLV
jgi:hypothetical protein